ncbi:MAG: hypothetical protein SGI90_04950 [Candidatus Eisenbacteria bacterium]|nr:hypothetical protein [Candidatus Eisenbacteria bacterium]
MTKVIRRFGAILALLVTGCAGGRSLVPLSELTTPPERDVYYVTAVSGEELEFITLTSDGLNVSGTVRDVQSRVVGRGEDERVESRSQYREVVLPLRDVARIEIDKPGSNPLLLVAAGAAVVGGAFLIFGGTEDTPVIDDGGGGRPPPDLP